MDTLAMRSLLPSALACFLVFAAGGLQAQVSIPATLVGSYNLTLQATPQSPIQNGAAALVEIAADGLLCADGIEFSSPFTKTGIADRVFWTNTGANLEFSVNTVGAFAGISLAALNGTSYGTLTGPQTSSIPADCGLAAMAADLFALAETQHPDLFPASIFVFTQSNADSEFRYYPSTGIYLTVTTAGEVRLSGGNFGSDGVVVGNVEDILAEGILDLDAFTALPQLDEIDYRVSTYTLTIKNERPFSPVPPGTTLTFVLTSDYQLCVGETILAPTISGSGQLTWSNPDGRYFYRLGPEPVDGEVPDWDWERQGSFTLVDARGFVYGEFQGDRTSLDTECGDRLGQHPDLAEIGVMFALAEQLYPDIYPGGPQTFSRRSDGTVSRYYKESDVTVSITNRLVSAKGGPYGTGVVLGALEDVIAGFRQQEITVSIPASLSGTYALVFASAGPHTQIPNQNDLEMSLDQDGNLCLDGQILMNPYLDPADPEIIIWDNVQGGFKLALNTGIAANNMITIDMTSSQNLKLGQMTGTKTLMLPVCGGLLGNGVDMQSAQFVFDAAENFMSDSFPPSALTYNRLEGGKLLRYYPDTTVLVAVDANNVAVSGGNFGATPVVVGTLTEIKNYFRQTYNLVEAGSSSLAVTGTRILSFSNTPPLRQDVDISKSNVQAPVAGDIVAMRNAVQLALGSELHSNWAASFTVVTDSANKLVFDAVITDEVKSAFTRVGRRYELRFSYDR